MKTQTKKEIIKLLKEKHKEDNHGISVHECGYENCLIKSIIKELETKK